MTDQQQFFVDQSTQPIKAIAAGKKETHAQRMRRLKAIADATGRHFLHVYLEDEKRRKGNQR
jgi:hypothetical protein